MKFILWNLSERHVQASTGTIPVVVQRQNWVGRFCLLPQPFWRTWLWSGSIFWSLLPIFPSQMDFPKFVDRMLATPVESWDWHWIPIHLLCPPCAGYHVIGKMETFSEDTQYIIARAGLSDILKEVQQNNSKSKGSLFQLHLSYFRQLSRRQLDQLVHIYRW